MTKEQKFYNALRDIFVGAKVEGKSGYINLMKIKSRYYENGVFPKLQKDIEEALKPFPEFREELFDKLYTFFNRYFSESGSIYFRYTPIHQNVYEKVYTDDKDVILFWKTHMLYYVKTDRLFKRLEVETPRPSDTPLREGNKDSFKFFFDVSTLEHKRANEKREIVYEFKEKREDGVPVFTVSYSERGKKTKIVDTLRVLNKKGVRITEDTLERAFRVFEKQSEVDYFINRNAKDFLREQFNIWLYQYVFSGESEWTEKRIKQLQVLKDIAFKIIDFISQFEDELVRIWNKPKFVLNSNYVITLDKIFYSPLQKGNLVEKIIKHRGINEQIKEWKELGIIDDNFKISDIFITDLTGKKLNEKYKFLPIDTKYFKDLELEVLGLFDDLDNALDGWLIKSENYQALNTILPKFRERVQTIYIDPPFNKEQDADYFYSVKYKDSSWITLLENRLQLAKDILNPRGSIFVRCDYNGNTYVRMLMNEIFGEQNFRNEIDIKRNQALPKTGGVNLVEETENLYTYTKSDQFSFLNTLVKKDKPQWVDLGTRPSDKENNPPRIIEEKQFYPSKFRRWSYSQENLEGMYKNRRLKVENGKLKILLDKRRIGSNWTDIPGYSTTPTWGLVTENSEQLLNRVIDFSSKNQDLVLDFFLGSGTTTAVAHKLGRKWLGVEMGEHFWTVVLPRMKKVLAYDKSGISKEKDVKDNYNQSNAGGFFKYYELEQYEDTLRKVKYEDSDLFDNPYEDPYNQYVFMRDIKMLGALEIDYKNNKVNVDLSKLYAKIPRQASPATPLRKGNIDISETLSNLLGKWIKRITHDYVEFEDGEKIDIKNLDYKLIKPLIWW